MDYNEKYERLYDDLRNDIFFEDLSDYEIVDLIEHLDEDVLDILDLG